MTRSTGAALVRRALEEVGVRHTFGIPGVHTTELYDELSRSSLITPHLVTSEFGAGFAADAVTRTGGLGCLVLVPGAGITHAASGIAEAFLDGIAMLVVTGGVRGLDDYAHQLHHIDQEQLVSGFTKGYFRIDAQRDAVETIRRAAELAVGGVPGPVVVELPVDVGLQLGTVDEIPAWAGFPEPPAPDEESLERAVEVLRRAKCPAIFAGWGARGARAELVRIAELLQAPVVTSLQGLAVFPHDHPLHAGFTFGPAAVPAARGAVDDHDALLAVGVRFAEIATGSYSIPTPKNLVHVDIDPDVIGANYPASVGVVGDATVTLRALVDRLAAVVHTRPRGDLVAQIADDKATHRAAALAAPVAEGRVSPAALFDAVQRAVTDPIVTLDDGNHTFLAAELWQVRDGSDLIGPSDFNAMGYAVPAAVGAKIANPQRQVVTFVGDGCFRMSGLELATLAGEGLGAAVFVMNDGELSQIAQAQEIPYARKTCTVLPELAVEGIALATGARFFRIDALEHLDEVVDAALACADSGRPAVVDVQVDYSQKSTYTGAILAANAKRLPLADKAHIGMRAVGRRIPGRR